MREALRSLTILAEDRMPNGRVPVPPHTLRRVNILLSRIAPARETRLQLLAILFGQVLTTSKELTTGQAVALISLAYPNGGIVPEPSFVRYLEERCNVAQTQAGIPIPDSY